MDRQEKVRILSAMYKEVTPIGDDKFYCVNGDDVEVLNADGGTIIKGKSDDISIRGSFMYNRLEDQVVNVKTYANRVFPNMIRADKLSEDYLAIVTRSVTYIVDKYLTDVLITGDLTDFKGYNETSTRIQIRYTVNPYYIPKGFMVLNKLNNTIESYGKSELIMGYDAIAVELQRAQFGISLSSESYPCFKYKLAKYDAIIGEVAHEDIIKPVGIQKPEVFYSVDKWDTNEYVELPRYTGGTVGINSTSRKEKLGIIGLDGSEILPAMADEILNIGANNYMISYKDTNDTKRVFIYNILTKSVIIDPMPETKCFMHSSLPMAIIQLDGAVAALDSQGRIFNILEIAKYYNCSYCKSRPDIIAINIGTITKYVTNTLEAITNVHAIAKLNKEEWVKM